MYVETQEWYVMRSDKTVLKQHILIVDDDESVRYMLETKFMNAGYSVTSAANGSHAIQILQSGKKFALMICDLKMQNKSGIEVIQFLKTTEHKMPVMILTAFPDRDKVMAAASLGVRDVIVKPVRHHELLTMVKSKLEGLDSEKAAA
jgi:CheY-like chemotaxis protein